MPKERWPENSEFKLTLDSLWDENYGDRRQEIVFIGLSAEMDKQVISARLDACLLDDYLSDEKAYKTENDPFPLWFQKAS